MCIYKHRLIYFYLKGRNTCSVQNVHPTEAEARVQRQEVFKLTRGFSHAHHKTFHSWKSSGWAFKQILGEILGTIVRFNRSFLRKRSIVGMSWHSLKLPVILREFFRDSSGILEGMEVGSGEGEERREREGN